MSDFLYGVVGVPIVMGIVVAGLVAGTPGGQGATFRDRILSTPILAPTLILHYFLPYGLIILTLFMDIMSQLPQGVFGLAIGFVLMVLNWAIGGKPDFPNDLCEIPGMKGFASKLMPQSLLFVSTIVFYLASFVTVSSGNLNYSTNSITSDNALAPSATGSLTAVSPSPSTRVGASWGLAIAVVLIQLFGILSTPGCLVDSLTISGLTLPPTARAILAIVVGGAIGGGLAVPIANSSISQPSFAVTTSATSRPFVPGILPKPNPKDITQSRGPGFVREQFQLGAGLGEMPMPSQGGGAPIDIAKSSGAVTPGESSDQFVCEAYKNGQLVTSTLVG